MKYCKILITTLLVVIMLLIVNTKVEAASAEISTLKQIVEVGENVTITLKFTAAAWNLKVSGNGITGESYASQTSDLTEAKTEKTFNLDTSKAGTYTISLKGDITDKDGKTIEIDKSCKVTVNAKKVDDKETSTNPSKPTTTPSTTTPSKPTTTPSTTPSTTTPSNPTTTTPSTPPAEEKPKEVEFKTVNETVYATGTVNVRKECSSEATKLGTLSKGDSVTRIGKSTSKADGYYWSKITYNGQTAYVINSKISTTKPEEEPEKTVEEPKEDKPKEDNSKEPISTVVDEPKENTENLKDLKGLKILEIEGITLSPKFETGIYNYEAVLKEDIKELKINAETIEKNETVVIAGNKDLQEGENLISIIVYSIKNEAVATYQIVVNKNTVDMSITDDMLRYGNQAATLKTTIYMVAIILVTILLVTVLIIKYKKQNIEEMPNKEEKEPIEEKKGKHF